VGNPWPVRVGYAAREAAGGRGTGKGAAGRGSGTRGDEARAMTGATGLDGRAARRRRRLPSGASLGALGNEQDKPVRREEDEPGVKGERKVVSGAKK
jgi:hypothetical protein